jgi:DNA-binding LytR/AlgR family response regulator
VINLTICDDEPAEAEYLRQLARQWAAERGVPARISVYESAEAFVFGDAQAVIMLLDIQMKGMDGVELARRIRQTSSGSAVQIIFITGLPDYIAEGYDVSALHYLMKPVSEAKLHEVLDRALARLERAGAPLLVAAPDGTVRVMLGDIYYIEAFAHSSVINTKDGAFETKQSISELEKAVGDGFVRCHRSYLAGLAHISRITKSEVVLDGGGSIPLSRRLYKDVNRAFISYYSEGRGPTGAN